MAQHTNLPNCFMQIAELQPKSVNFALETQMAMLLIKNKNEKNYMDESAKFTKKKMSMSDFLHSKRYMKGTEFVCYSHY